MNHRRFDQLFKEHLTEYQQAPPTQAWDKLETQLAKSNPSPRRYILKIAAAVIILALTVTAVVYYGSDPSNNIITEHTPLTIPSNSVDPPDQIATGSSPTHKEKSGVSAQIPDLKQDEQLVGSTLVSSNLEPAHSPISETVKPGKDKVFNTNSKTPHKSEETQGQLSTKNLEQKPAKPRIVITYKKAPAPPEPTLALVEEANPDTGNVKKIWLKAMDIRHSDFGLAHIRAAKDQLFAFNRILEKNKNEEQYKDEK